MNPYVCAKWALVCAAAVGAAQAQEQIPASVPQKASTQARLSVGKSAKKVKVPPAVPTQKAGAVTYTPVGPGWDAATQAYADYSKGLFAASAEGARKAVAAEPDNKDYRYLLVNALQGAGLADETLVAVRDALSKFGPDETWLSVESLLLTQRGAAVASEVYRSLERNDLPAAIGFAEQAVVLAPDVMAYRASLVDLLMRAKRWPEADGVVTELLAQEPLEVSAWALRAVIRHAQGDYGGAVADFEHAFTVPDLDNVQHRWLRLTAVDSALKARDISRAKAWLSHPVLATGKDTEWRNALAQREAALTKLSGPKLAQTGREQVTADVLIPVQRCRLTPYGRACLLLPGVPSADAGYEAASAAFQLMKSLQYGEAAQQARLAMTREPGNGAYKQLLFDILSADKQTDAALVLAREYVAEQPKDLPWRLRLSGLLFDVGQSDVARSELRNAVSLVPADGVGEADVAYMATRIQDHETAQSLYLRMADTNRLKGSAWGDAAFSVMRLKMDYTALQFLRNGIDDLSAAKGATDVTQVTGQIDMFRQASAELSRIWGLTSSLTLSRELSVPGSTGLAGAVAPASSTVVGAEAYWRPFGYRNGQLFEVFARGYATLSSSTAGPKGLGNGVGAVGVRGKPTADFPLMFSAWRQLPLGVLGESDWVVQASYFQGWGTDVRATLPAWWTGQVTGEWSRALRQGQTYAAVEGRLGRSFKWEATETAWALQPFASLKAEYNTQALDRSTQGLDVGVSLKRAFREDRYTAPMSTLELEWRHRLKQWGGGKPGAAIKVITSY
jgi:adsorption protein A